MQIFETKLPGVFQIRTEPFIDERGGFGRLYCGREFEEAGIQFDPVQMNLSTNTKMGTLRGLHYKTAPHGEQKVVRVVKGRVLDVVVDVRPESATYLQHLTVELSSKNMIGLFVPQGFAHGFVTLEDDSDVLYQMGRYYEPGNEAGLRWNDPRLAINWPVEPRHINDRDAGYPQLGGS